MTQRCSTQELHQHSGGSIADKVESAVSGPAGCPHGHSPGRTGRPRYQSASLRGRCVRCCSCCTPPLSGTAAAARACSQICPAPLHTPITPARKRQRADNLEVRSVRLRGKTHERVINMQPRTIRLYLVEQGTTCDLQGRVNSSAR